MEVVSNPSLLGPIMTILFPVVGHFLTASMSWARRAKVALTVVGCVFVALIIALIVIPSVALGTVVADDNLTISEINQAAWGVYIGCIICSLGLFACYVAGIVLSFREYYKAQQDFQHKAL